jgi:HAD superfamily hydrolase (TIGR01450 family)
MLACGRPLAEEFDVGLLDLDGVVYLGEQPIPGVPEALHSARRYGMRLAFVTNNASRTPHDVAGLLTRLGVPAEPAEVTTSSHAAAHYLADRLDAGAAVLVLGTEALAAALAERGLRPVRSAGERPAAVVQGYSPDLDWHALAEGMVAIRNGALWVATNLDPTVPSPRGPLPGNGSLVAALRHASGVSPVSTGKPDPTMHAESVQRSGAKNPLVVGDRLDTDIEGARRVGCRSLLVLSGVTDAADLLYATSLHRPDFLGRDAASLLAAHPPVTVEADRVTCRAWAVSGRGPELVLTEAACDASAGPPPGHDLDALRAVTVASWRALDGGAEPRPVPGDASATKVLVSFGLG